MDANRFRSTGSHFVGLRTPLKPGRPGHLLFVRGETLWAQSFNADRLELQGDAIPSRRAWSDLPGIGSGAIIHGFGERRTGLRSWEFSRVRPNVA